MKLVVLASGRGSGFAAIADAVARGEIADSTVQAVFCNKRTAPVIDLAKERQIRCDVLVASEFADKDAHERALVDAIRALGPDWICLAGYTRLLGTTFLAAFPGKVINVHPSLLPAFKGLHAQKQALEYGVLYTGCTIHIVNEELDAGPILEQATLPVLPDDTEESLSQRLLPLEHRAYINALKKLASKELRLKGRRVAWA